jgi:hypothetical protein
MSKLSKYKINLNKSQTEDTFDKSKFNEYLRLNRLALDMINRRLFEMKEEKKKTMKLKGSNEDINKYHNVISEMKFLYGLAYHVRNKSIHMIHFDNFDPYIDNQEV